MQRRFTNLLARKFRKVEHEQVGTIGLADGTIDDTDNPGYSWVRLTDGTALSCWRENVPGIYRLPVVIGKKNGRNAILRLWDTYAGAAPVPMIREHAFTHKSPMPGDPPGTGYDWTPTEIRQITWLRVSVDNSTLKIDVGKGAVYLSDTWLKFDGARQVDLSGYVPANGACWLLVEIYNNSGVPTLAYTASSSFDFDEQDYSAIPATTNERLALAAIRLYARQLAIQESIYATDILDLRFSQAMSLGSTVGPIDVLQFNTSYTTTEVEPVASVFWDADNHGLTVVLENGIRLQIGQEGVFWAVNKTGSTIANGTPVYISGVQGNRPTIAPCKGDADATAFCAGVTTQEFLNNAEGYVTFDGAVHDMTTLAGFAEGDGVWVSKTTAGELVNAEPTKPHHSDKVGVVLSNHATQGILLVKIARHLSMNELSNVNSTPPSVSGDLLVWNAATGIYDAGTYNILDLPYIRTAPSTAAQNTIQPSADIVNLTLKQKASGTKNLTDWKNISDVILAFLGVTANNAVFSLTNNVALQNNDTARLTIADNRQYTTSGTKSPVLVSVSGTVNGVGTTIGNNAIGYNSTLSSAGSQTHSGTMIGANFAAYEGKTAGGAPGIIGGRFRAGFNHTIATGTAASSIIGGAFSLDLYNGDGSTSPSSVTNAYQAFFGSSLSNFRGVAVTNMYGAYIDNNAPGALASIATQYGLYVSAQTAAAINYAIYTNGGLVRLGDVLITNGRRNAIATKTANYTATANDDVIVCNGTGITITLPAAAGVIGQEYVIKNKNISPVIVDGDGSDTIDGQLTQTVNQWSALKITADASGSWIIV